MNDIREGDRFLTIEEVAERLHVCRASIYVWLKHGFPRPLKFGKASRWKSIDIEEWIKTRPKGVYGEEKKKTKSWF